MAEDLFAGYGVFRWVVGGFDIPLPVGTWKHARANRLVAHERIYRKGARHDDTGSKAVRWTATFLAHNDSDEPGIPADYYPTMLFKLEASMEVHETGTLYTTRGPRRCRFESMEESESRTEGVDASPVTCVWVEDNEDDVNANSFQLPSARSVAQTQLLLVGNGVNSVGIGGGDFFQSLASAVAALVALADTPGNVLSQIQAQAQIILDSIDQVEIAFTTATPDALDGPAALLLDPLGASPGRLLRRLADTCARAVNEVAMASANQAIVTRVYSETISIFGIATDVEQDAYDLITLNDQLESPYAIPPNTPIKVYATSSASTPAGSTAST